MDNFDKYYQKALFFLSFRQRSEKEIRDYLKKKKAPEEITDKIIKNLKINKFLNDEEFVKWWIEQRTIIRPKSTRIIKIELQRKGIDRQLIENLLPKDSEGDFAKAKKLAEKRISRYGKVEDRRKVFEKMARYLASKGFDYDIIKEVIDQVLGKEYN